MSIWMSTFVSIVSIWQLHNCEEQGPLCALASLNSKRQGKGQIWLTLTKILLKLRPSHIKILYYLFKTKANVALCFIPNFSKQQKILTLTVAVLPDFSWYKIPKREKYTKLPQNIPNYHKIYQMSIKYSKRQ
jgi:hypothetical protein